MVWTHAVAERGLDIQMNRTSFCKLTPHRKKEADGSQLPNPMLL
jgi:hypothetical protein